MTDAERARHAHAAGDIATASAHYQRALAAAPGDAMLMLDYAILLMQMAHRKEAATLLREVRRHMPDDARALLALVVCLRVDGEIEEALRIAEEATGRLPHDAAAWMLRGSIEVRGGHYARAETALRRALLLAPAFGEAWHYLGESLHHQQRWAEAIQAYRKAAEEQPGEIYNIAMCAEQAGDLELARDSYQQASGIFPGRADVLLRLAQTQARLCDFSGEHAALDKFRRVVAHGIPAGQVLEVFPLTYLPLEASLVQHALDRYMGAVLERAPSHAPSDALQTIHPEDRIRIGYLSSDFGMHAVGQLVGDVFRSHDRDRFEVFAYSLRTYDDPVAAGIREGCDVYVDCASLGTTDIVQRIRHDGIHVLIDLNGPTVGARLEILAVRPAPLQLGWLGFLHAQQAPWLDALLLDEHVQPSDNTWSFKDRIVHLPVSLFPPAPGAGGQRQRERFGMPAEGRVVLASFNNSYKLDMPLVAAWIRILELAPDATLMVYLPATARPGFLRHWHSLGGSPSRLMVVDALAPGDQADRAASCDLMLDAFRYQGGATSLDAVTSGLPVLCRTGETPPARLGVSINRALGLEDLVVADTEEYIRRAAWLANHPAELGALRQRVKAAVQQSGFSDPRRSAAAVEQVCEQLLREKGVLA
ncbi:tetratricopeptide repeat protein [Pseudoxanthomonas sp. PXM02]|uniref:O-linked N-acetylglucosamine transferase, SPINDLY family protein n=1 Tax=Pseudoxanthomonas sp. PXM02 TaxID=2769294 RepID=UPI001783E203|nr:tetratricopeptide repeat protein [Pseudoxanthomonas sp. PXM02]MBD9479487.1 tetratricopeptide repeat protein [Pseudoxanthomonas sp. PXM02]